MADDKDFSDAETSDVDEANMEATDDEAVAAGPEADADDASQETVDDLDDDEEEGTVGQHTLGTWRDHPLVRRPRAVGHSWASSPGGRWGCLQSIGNSLGTRREPTRLR